MRLAALQGVDAIPWARLQHAYGSAEDVPELLRALGSRDSKERKEALSALFGNIYHQDTVYDATRYAVPFLVELATTRSLPGRADTLGLLGHIANCLDGRARGEVRDEVARHAEVIGRLLSDPVPAVRAGAAFVLGGLPELTSRIGPRLRKAIERDTNALARAGMLLGLSNLRDHSAENVEWLGRRFAAAKGERERFAAAVALAHAAREATPPRAVSLLARASADPEANSRRFAGLHWDVAGESLPREALVAVGRAAYPVLPVILQALRTAPPVDASFALDDALAIVFPDAKRYEKRRPLDELQRDVLRALVGASQIWKSPNLLVGTLSSYGLPTSRDELRTVVGA